MAVYYWVQKLIDELRRLTGSGWVHVFNDDGSITSLKVGAGI